MVKKPDGSLEAEILRILWSSRQPLSPSQVRSRLVDDLAYTSVATVLSRLMEKGLLERSVQGRTFVYETTISESEWLSQRMESVLAQARDRSELLAGFVGRLSKRDVKELRKILAVEDAL